MGEITGGTEVLNKEVAKFKDLLNLPVDVVPHTFQHFGNQNCHYCLDLVKLFVQKPVEIQLGGEQRKTVYKAHIWMTCICSPMSTEKNQSYNY